MTYKSTEERKASYVQRKTHLPCGQSMCEEGEGELASGRKGMAEGGL